MADVKRWQLSQCNSGACVSELQEHERGAWVHFDDHEQTIAELRAEVQRYEHMVLWNVTCEGCADSLDKSADAYFHEENQKLREKAQRRGELLREIRSHFPNSPLYVSTGVLGRDLIDRIDGELGEEK